MDTNPKLRLVGNKVRILVIFGLLLTLGGVSSGNGAAASASLTPGIRTVCVGSNASFSGSWGNYSPYEVLYDSGGGSPAGYYNASTTSTSRSFSAAYSEGTFDTLLEVIDSHNDYANASGEVRSGYWSGCPF